MNAREFFGLAKKGELINAYLIHGEEEYTKDRAVEEVLKNAQPDFVDFNVDFLDNPSIDELFAVCQQLPIMAEKRFVIVRNSSLFSLPANQSKKAIEVINDLPDTVCCIFVVRGKCDERKALFKAFCKDSIVKCEIYSDIDAARFAIGIAKKRGKQLGMSQATKIISMIGPLLENVSKETEKLCDYCYDQNEIDEDAIVQCVQPSLEYSVFNILDALIGKRMDYALMMINDQIKNGGNGAAISLLMFFASRFNLMYSAKMLQESGNSSGQIVKLLGINPYAAKMTIKQASSFSIDELKKAVLDFAQADIGIKRGNISDFVALQTVLLKIFAV